MKRFAILLCLGGLLPVLAGCGARQGNAAEFPTNTENPPATAPVQKGPAQKLPLPPNAPK